MPYWFEYEVAPGWDADPGDFLNFETFFNVPLRGRRVPLGAVSKKTLDKAQHWYGSREISLSTEACTFDELDAYVTEIFGDWDTQNQQVTLRTRNRDNTFSYWNAKAHIPVDEQDYQHVTVNQLRDVALRFDIIGVAA